MFSVEETTELFPDVIRSGGHVGGGGVTLDRFSARKKWGTFSPKCIGFPYKTLLRY